MTLKDSPPADSSPQAGYVLDEQVGFLLRQVSQRHAVIFMTLMGENLTPTQWAALAKLHQLGPQSQNHLGRLTAMDAATIKGVVDRLMKRGLVETRPDPEGGRRLLVALTPDGEAMVKRCTPRAVQITEETMRDLTASERKTLLALLRKML